MCSEMCSAIALRFIYLKRALWTLLAIRNFLVGCLSIQYFAVGSSCVRHIFLFIKFVKLIPEFVNLSLSDSEMSIFVQPLAQNSGDARLISRARV